MTTESPKPDPGVISLKFRQRKSIHRSTKTLFFFVSVVFCTCFREMNELSTKRAEAKTQTFSADPWFQGTDIVKDIEISTVLLHGVILTHEKRFSLKVHFGVGLRFA